MPQCITLNYDLIVCMCARVCVSQAPRPSCILCGDRRAHSEYWATHSSSSSECGCMCVRVWLCVYVFVHHHDHAHHGHDHRHGGGHLCDDSGSIMICPRFPEDVSPLQMHVEALRSEMTRDNHHDDDHADSYTDL